MPFDIIPFEFLIDPANPHYSKLSVQVQPLTRQFITRLPARFIAVAHDHCFTIQSQDALDLHPHSLVCVHWNVEMLVSDSISYIVFPTQALSERNQFLSPFVLLPRRVHKRW